MRILSLQQSLLSTLSINRQDAQAFDGKGGRHRHGRDFGRPEEW